MRWVGMLLALNLSFKLFFWDLVGRLVEESMVVDEGIHEEVETLTFEKLI